MRRLSLHINHKIIAVNTSKILFISHDAQRTGAPIVFLHFLKWFKEHARIPFHILLKGGGELEPEFEALAPVRLFYKHTSIHSGALRSSWHNPLYGPLLTRFYLKYLKERLTREQYRLIYINTSSNSEVLGLLDKLTCPVICHVHELDCWIRYRTGLDRFELLKQRVNHYIAVSQAVKHNLVEQYEISEEDISVVYESIPTQSHQFQDDEQLMQARQHVCRQLQIPEHAKIVCASGTTDWRKGPELFIQLAQAIHASQKQPPVYFLWVGGAREGLQFGQLRHDVQTLGMEKYVRFLGAQNDPLSYFAASDVFVLTSREDPFPLVCLEAASLAKPIVCFDRAGGMPEFVEDDAGRIVPYLDLDRMAATVLNLLNTQELRIRLGQQARQKVRERYDIHVTSPKILRTIREYFF